MFPRTRANIPDWMIRTIEAAGEPVPALDLETDTVVMGDESRPYEDPNSRPESVQRPRDDHETDNLPQRHRRGRQRKGMMAAELTSSVQKWNAKAF